MLLCTKSCTYLRRENTLKVLISGSSEVNLPFLTLIQSCLIPNSAMVRQRPSLHMYLFLPTWKGNYIGYDQDEKSKDDVIDSDEKLPELNLPVIAKPLAQLDHSGGMRKETKDSTL